MGSDTQEVSKPPHGHYFRVFFLNIVTGTLFK